MRKIKNVAIKAMQLGFIAESENIFRELEFSPSLKVKIKDIFVPFEKIVVI